MFSLAQAHSERIPQHERRREEEGAEGHAPAAEGAADTYESVRNTPIKAMERGS